MTQPDSDPLTDLRKQVASLQSQLTSLIEKKQKKASKPMGKAEGGLSKIATSTPTIKVTSDKPANLEQSTCGTASSVVRMATSQRVAVSTQTPFLSQIRVSN